MDINIPKEAFRVGRTIKRDDVDKWFCPDCGAKGNIDTLDFISESRNPEHEEYQWVQYCCGEWLIKNGLSVSHLITDYYNGIDSINEKTRYTINKQKDEIYIIQSKYYTVKKEKFVHKRDKTKIISQDKLETIKITVPFTITVEEIEEWRDYTKFHNDCELVKYTVKTKHYKEPDFKEFLKEKLKKYDISI